MASNPSADDILGQMSEKDLAKLRRAVARDKFKNTYGADIITPLKCPVCKGQDYLATATLWQNAQDPTKFVCADCKRVFKIEWLSGDINVLMESLRQERREQRRTKGGKYETS